MAGLPTRDPVCVDATAAPTMASAREFAVMLVRESTMGELKLMLLACSWATIAARLGRSGTGAGRDLGRGLGGCSVLVCRVVSDSESV